MDTFPDFLDQPQSGSAQENPEYFLPRNISVNRRLRACMNCGLLKLLQEFRNEGCENCEIVFRFKENPDRILIFTSLKFEGIVGITEHNRSWKNQYIATTDKFCVGIYALFVFARVPDHILEQVAQGPWEEIISERRDGFRLG